MGGCLLESTFQKRVAAESLWLKRWSVLWSAGFALGVTLFFGSFAYRAWRVAALSPTDRVERAEAMLRYVGDQLKNHNGIGQFEEYFPDAGMVAYFIYGEALVNVGVAERADLSKRMRLAREVEWCLECLYEPDVLERFPTTQVPYGLFFLSRRTLLLAGLHLISDSPFWRLTEEYHENCQLMANAFASAPYGLVDSFRGFCWPPDNLAALRSLRLHDEKFGTDYSSVVEEWKEWAEGALDPKTGTLPFDVNSATGEPQMRGRGSSLALSLIELRDVDPELFEQQYSRFRRHFGNSFLGLRTWREFARGQAPDGDIGTGPIVRGHGVLATLTGMIAAKLAGDEEAFCGAMGFLEAVAMPSTTSGMRRYLRGKTLILDAIGAYALSAVPWTREARKIPRLSSEPRAPWLLIAALMAIPSLTIATSAIRYWRTVRKARPLSLWHSPSPSSEGMILFWCQAALTISVFFSTLLFPVIWAGFGGIGRAASLGLRVAKQSQWR